MRQKSRIASSTYISSKNIRLPAQHNRCNVINLNKRNFERVIQQQYQ